MSSPASPDAFKVAVTSLRVTLLKTLDDSRLALMGSRGNEMSRGFMLEVAQVIAKDVLAPVFGKKSDGFLIDALRIKLDYAGFSSQATESALDTVRGAAKTMKMEAVVAANAVARRNWESIGNTPERSDLVAQRAKPTQEHRAG